MLSRRLCLAVAATLTLSPFVANLEGTASAAGLYFSDRGVRPLARGGAFVAGADDLGAIWYNPAGLADAGSSMLVDFAWLHFNSEYTRQTQVADSAGTLRTYNSPTVDGKSPVLPIPTIGASFNFGEKKEFTGAFGIIAPYTAITTYPLTVDGMPSPSRYALVSLEGSALVIPGLYFAYKPIEQVRVGIGVQALVGTFKSTTVFSASPSDRLVGAPEDPQYDTFSELKVGPIFAPSANAGATFIPEKHVHIGISGQLPFSVAAPAKITVKLPTSPVFDKASQDGQDATVRFKLPAVLRAGVEFRNEFSDKSLLRVELAYVREFWSAHESIDVSPTNIKLLNVTGFPSPFAVSNISIPRHFIDSNSIRLGGEYRFKIEDYVIDARLGANYETSAIPNAYVSPLTVDGSNKVMLGAGGGLHLGDSWRIDLTYAHVFTNDETVLPGDAKLPRINPVQGNPTQTEAVNGGYYSQRADLFGVGMNYKF